MFKAQRQVEGTGKLLSFAVIVPLKRYFEENGAPERIRTSDRSVRSRVLYPAELRALKKWRRGRDSNPRYPFKRYGSLAGNWFQPLTHLSAESAYVTLTF